MKKYINIFVCISLFLSSCSSNFIDLQPTSTVTQDFYYRTDKDFQDALTGIYAPIRTSYNYFYIFGDIRGDDSWVQIAKTNSQTYSDQFTTMTTDTELGNFWQRSYQAIFRANMLLSRIEGVSESDIPNKARYIAEARFLRALCYFDMVRVFGPVPAVTTVLTVPESYRVPRSPVEDIYNNIIIPDFKAAESLPVSYSGADIGRPTQGAAKAMLGKIYLTIGDFPNAESKLLEITTMGYDLETDYESIFDPANKRHKGYIFDIEYAGGVSAGSRLTNAFMPNFPTMANFFGVRGTCDEWNNPTQALINLFEPDDIRKEISVGIYGGFYNADNVFVSIPSNTNQTYTKKYITSIPAANDSPVNWKVVRYADVLLMLAEALNENGKTALAIPHLNRVRARAQVSEYPLNMNQTATRAAIEKERRLELCFEGHRWFDLVRTGKAYETMKGEGMQPYMTVFPIPLSQVQLINNPAILPQNPGYH
jgi:hypothetical protein